MGSWIAELDPDVRQVLEDVVKQGGRGLALNPSIDYVDPLENIEVGWTAPGLTTAERHLLRAHREELWFFLYQAFQAKKLEDLVGQTLYGETNSTSASPEYLRRRASSLIRLNTGDPLLHELAEGHLSSVGYADIARLCRRTREVDVSHLLEAEAANLVGHYQAAISVAARTMESLIRPDLRIAALLHLGLARCELGQHQEALDAVERAIDIDSNRPILAVSYLMAALFAGDRDRCTVSSQFFEHHFPAHSIQWKHEVDLYRMRWAEDPPPLARIAQPVEDLLGPSARGLLHAIQA